MRSRKEYRKIATGHERARMRVVRLSQFYIKNNNTLAVSKSASSTVGEIVGAIDASFTFSDLEDLAIQAGWPLTFVSITVGDEIFSKLLLSKKRARRFVPLHCIARIKDMLAFFHNMDHSAPRRTTALPYVRSIVADQ